MANFANSNLFMGVMFFFSIFAVGAVGRLILLALLDVGENMADAKSTREAMADAKRTGTRNGEAMRGVDNNENVMYFMVEEADEQQPSRAGDEYGILPTIAVIAVAVIMFVIYALANKPM